MVFENLFDLSTPAGQAFAVGAIAVLVVLYVFGRRRPRVEPATAHADEDIVVEWPDEAGGQLTLEPWMTSAEVRAVLAAITKDGKDARFVGGCVRNALMHVPVTDIDIATQEIPERVMALLEAAGIKAIPTGIEHGTVTAVVNGKHFEITTLRRDVETDGRRAVVAFTDDWREDALRRDFTFNALSATPEGKVFDYFNGMQDLAHRLIRFVGRVDERIREDRLRILRYFRFIAVYGMRIASRYEYQVCVKAAPTLAELSAERIQGELIKILGSSNQHDAVRLMLEEGIFDVILPEAKDISWFKRLVWLDSNALRIEAVQPDWLRRLAALVDTDADGAEALARRLKLSRAQIERLRRLKAWEWTADPKLGEAEFKGVLHKLGAGYVIDLILLEWSKQLIIAPRLPKWETEAWQTMLRRAEEWQGADFPIKGGDVVALGVAPGPRVSELLREVEEWWRRGGCVADRAATLSELEKRLS
jgi:poly(A) polymerase